MRACASPPVFLPSPVGIIQEAELQSLIKTRGSRSKVTNFHPQLLQSQFSPPHPHSSSPCQCTGGFSSTSCANTHPNTMQNSHCQNISWCWIWVFPWLLNLHGLVLLSKMAIFLLFSQLFASEAAAEEPRGCLIAGSKLWRCFWEQKEIQTISLNLRRCFEVLRSHPDSSAVKGREFWTKTNQSS